MSENKEILSQTPVEKSQGGETQQREKIHEVMKDIQETEARVPHEIKSWLTKIEMDPNDMKSVADDSGNTVLQPISSQSTKIKLPVSRKTFLGGLVKTVGDTGLWLSKYILKMIKKSNGNVKFKEDE